MLQPEEARDNQLVLNLPGAEHFTTPYNGRERVLDIRVNRKETQGQRVSLVTHIRRPRDGEWQCIEGSYEGAEAGTVNGRPFWLREVGAAIPFVGVEAQRQLDAGRLRGGEDLEWMYWDRTTPDELRQWLNDDGSVRVVRETEIAGIEDQVHYKIAHRRAALV